MGVIEHCQGDWPEVDLIEAVVVLFQGDRFPGQGFTEEEFLPLPMD
jgi:hypothetical protein